MHHLKLIKGLSYWNAFVKATKDHPDIYVEDGPAYESAMKSGYFEEVEDKPQSEDPEGGDPESTTMAPADTEDPEGTETDGMEDMSVSELKAYAQLNGIDLGGAKKKDEILETIRAAEAHAAEVRASLRGE